jgi:hypothetical protein
MSRKQNTTGGRPPAETGRIVPTSLRPENLPRSAVTPDGRLIPLTDAERRDYEAGLAKLWEELAEEGPEETDGPAVWDEVMRRIDEGRPHRPLFGGTEG